MNAREFIRNKSRPSISKALNFARNVMLDKGVDVPISPYTFADGMSIQNAHKALKEHAVDYSEFMAFEMCDFALNPD